MTPQKSRFAAVCFDFDSTLTRLEGIDELAARKGVEKDIAPLTVAAMEGTIPLESVYARRLDLIRPAQADVVWLAERYIDAMVPGVEETFAALRRAGTEIFIVSGGIRAAILPFVARLELPPVNVFAVNIAFDAAGAYRDFDRTSPLTKADGKAEVCGVLLERHAPLAMVGDGITDMAARHAGAFAIGFGGVTARAAVRSKADVFIEEPSLTATLDCLLACK